MGNSILEPSNLTREFLCSQFRELERAKELEVKLTKLAKLGRLSERPPMGGYRYLQPNNADRSGRHCHGIMSRDALGDARQPGARDDLLRLRY